jgi:hypothetical protein
MQWLQADRHFCLCLYAAVNAISSEGLQRLIKLDSSRPTLDASIRSMATMPELKKSMSPSDEPRKTDPEVCAYSSTALSALQHHANNTMCELQC